MNEWEILLVQNLENQNNKQIYYEVKSLSDILKMENGEDYFNLVAEEFVSKNKDVEHFLKKSAVSSTRLHQSATYLVFIKNEVAGFFTLAIKTINVLADVLSKKEQKIINFYEKHNFKNLDSSRITKNNKELLQMYSIR